MNEYTLCVTSIVLIIILFQVKSIIITGKLSLRDTKKPTSFVFKLSIDFPAVDVEDGNMSSNHLNSLWVKILSNPFLIKQMISTCKFETVI